MKKLTSWIIALALSGSALLAQNITGTWQGALKVPNRELRTVVKISMGDDALKALFYSIDQGGQGLPASSVTLQGSTVKIAIAGIGGQFEGKLSADGNTIAGTWTQGPNPLPLTLTRATAETAWTIPTPPPPQKPMAADANPVFEVATIKPSNPDTPGKFFLVNARQFSTLNTTLSELITFAYGIHPKQITNAPGWLESDKYDLLAKPDGEGQPNSNQWKTMLQKLLADRFKLAFHRDKKELSVYAIVVGKTGAKLTKSEGDPNGLPALFFQGLGTLPARNATIGEFAGLLQAVVLERPVLDQTGLQGRFDFTLKWTPDDFQFQSLGPRPPAPPPDNVAARPRICSPHSSSSWG